MAEAKPVVRTRVDMDTQAFRNRTVSVLTTMNVPSVYNECIDLPFAYISAQLQMVDDPGFNAKLNGYKCISDLLLDLVEPSHTPAETLLSKYKECIVNQGKWHSLIELLDSYTKLSSSAPNFKDTYKTIKQQLYLREYADHSLTVLFKPALTAKNTLRKLVGKTPFDKFAQSYANIFKHHVYLREDLLTSNIPESLKMYMRHERTLLKDASSYQTFVKTVGKTQMALLGLKLNLTFQGFVKQADTYIVGLDADYQTYRMIKKILSVARHDNDRMHLLDNVKSFFKSIESDTETAGQHKRLPYVLDLLRLVRQVPNILNYAYSLNANTPEERIYKLFLQFVAKNLTDDPVTRQQSINKIYRDVLGLPEVVVETPSVTANASEEPVKENTGDNATGEVAKNNTLTDTGKGASKVTEKAQEYAPPANNQILPMQVLRPNTLLPIMMLKQPVESTESRQSVQSAQTQRTVASPAIGPTATGLTVDEPKSAANSQDSQEDNYSVYSDEEPRPEQSPQQNYEQQQYQMQQQQPRDESLSIRQPITATMTSERKFHKDNDCTHQCPSIGQSMAKAMEVEFDYRILKRAVQLIYKTSDEVELFWEHRCVDAIAALNTAIDERISNMLAKVNDAEKPDQATASQGTVDQGRAKKYSQRLQADAIDLQKMVNRTYKRYAQDIYQFSFDLMTKQLPSKLAYIQYWKKQPAFDEVEDRLEAMRADDLKDIEQRKKDNKSADVIAKEKAERDKEQKTLLAKVADRAATLAANRVEKRENRSRAWMGRGGNTLLGESVEGLAWSSTGGANEPNQAGQSKDNKDRQGSRDTMRTTTVTLGAGNVYDRTRTHTFMDFDHMLVLMKELSLRHMNALNMAYNNSINKLGAIKSSLLQETIIEMDAAGTKTNGDLSLITNKLSAIYNSEYSFMDIVFDTQFMVIYALKLFNYGFFALSLFLAEKLFSEMYMKSVYGSAGNPPDILIYLGLTLALNVAFVIFMLTVLLLIMYIFRDPASTFAINPNLLYKFVVDYIITIVVVGLVGVIIGSIIQKKRYFRYKTEGLRGVRAFHELMLSLGALVVVVPFFYVL